MVTTGKDQAGVAWPGINGGMTPRMGPPPAVGEPVNEFIGTINADGYSKLLNARPSASTNPSSSASVMGVDRQPKIPRGERMNPYSSIL